MNNERTKDQQEIDTDQERRRVFLRYVNRSWLMFGFVTLITMPLFPEERTLFVYLAAVIFPTYLIVRFLNRFGKTRLAGVVFTFAVNFGFYGLFLILAGELGADEAFHSQATVWILMGLAVLFAGGLVNRWAAPAVALFDSVLLIGTRLALAPESDPRPSALVFWWMMAVVTWLYEGTLQQALARVWNELAERKRADDQLRKLSSSVEHGPASIVITDLEGTIQYVNPRFTEITGYTLDEVLGKNPRILQSGLTPRELYPQMWDTIKSGREWHGEFCNKKKNGDLYWESASISPITDEAGSIVNFVAVKEDITGRKQTEEALRESEIRYRLITQNAEDMIWTMNMDFQLTYVSPAVERALGYSAEEITSWTPERFLTPESYTIGLKVFNQEVQAAQPQPNPNYARVLELEYVRRNGSTFWVEMKFSFFRDAVGQPISVLGVGRDITERKQAEQQIRRQVKSLEALHRIDMAIASGLDVNISLGLLLEQLISILMVDAADILLLEPHTRLLRYAAGRGFYSNAIQHTQLIIGSGHAGRAALEKRTVHIYDLTNNLDELSRSSNLTVERFKSYFAVPLIVKGQVNGVLEIFHRSPLSTDREWVNFMETMANQAAITIEDAQLMHELQRSNLELAMAYDATIEGWTRALDLRDKETEGHTQRVTNMTLELAQALHVDQRDMIHIRRGALLHDIGNIGVPDSILLKSGELTEADWEIMRQHPTFAYEMLGQISYLKPALDIPYCHHEKWDGTGYPRGLKGEAIPIAARIFAVADVWDAVTNDRLYRKGWSNEKALEYIKDQSGKYFDPQVVELFFKLDLVKKIHTADFGIV